MIPSSGAAKDRIYFLACRSQYDEAMSPPPLERRVAFLEEQVNALHELPGRVRAIEVQLIEVRREAVAMEERLRADIRSGDEETRHQMRVLHEEVISRIALLQEGMSPPGARGRPSSRRRPPKHR